VCASTRACWCARYARTETTMRSTVRFLLFEKQTNTALRAFFTMWSGLCVERQRGSMLKGNVLCTEKFLTFKRDASQWLDAKVSRAKSELTFIIIDFHFLSSSRRELDSWSRVWEFFDISDAVPASITSACDMFIILRMICWSILIHGWLIRGG